MDKRTQKFDIISFTADDREYYPASMGRQNWMSDKNVKQTDIDIALGQSRYGGPVVDLPIGIEYPEGLRFAAQLDLAAFSPFDKTGLLPKKGQLIFFADIRNDIGKVIYADIPNEELIRVTKEHEEDFFSGVLIDQIFADTETFEERYGEEEDDYDDDDFEDDDDDFEEDLDDEEELDKDELDEDELDEDELDDEEELDEEDLDEEELDEDEFDDEEEIDEEDEFDDEEELEWNYFAGAERSKIFGIYTNCQLQEEEIEEITFSDKLVLLQVGENGFNDEGVFSVLIPKEDLKNLNFENCEFV
ncbi:DUF1963 domain-containing protein [Sphingobacterium sp. PU5-4]|uniref:DUF1963 domain-containing protein n=1 Tax=Sphingobacterium tenebrionis TaxID=3111775 RepID=A0ABU8I8X5_9SPHI